MQNSSFSMQNAPGSECQQNGPPAAKFILFNAKILVFDTQFLVFNTQFLVFNTEFMMFTHLPVAFLLRDMRVQNVVPFLICPLQKSSF